MLFVTMFSQHQTKCVCASMCVCWNFYVIIIIFVEALRYGKKMSLNWFIKKFRFIFNVWKFLSRSFVNLTLVLQRTLMNTWNNCRSWSSIEISKKKRRGKKIMHAIVKNVLTITYFKMSMQIRFLKRIVRDDDNPLSSRKLEF